MPAVSSGYKGGGFLPSPFDSRDYSIDKLVGGISSVSVDAPPDNYDAFFEGGHIGTVRDQGSSESCVGQDAASRTEAWASMHLGVKLSVSELAWYTGGRMLTAKDVREELTDTGANVAQVMKFGAKYGVVARERWPLRDIRGRISLQHTNQRLPLDVFQHAAEHKIAGYYFVPGYGSTLVDNLRLALSQGLPVGFAQPIDSAFDKYTRGTMKEYSGKNRGFHMTGMYGYRKVAKTGKFEFRCLNSWGVGYGEKGYYWISESRLILHASSFTALSVGVRSVT